MHCKCCWLSDAKYFDEDYDTIDIAVQQVQDDVSDLNIEEDFAGFLGISMLEQSPIGAIKLTQQSLIERVLVSLDPSNSHNKRTQAKLHLYLQLRMEMQSPGTIFL